jgi:hypothetical protein
MTTQTTTMTTGAGQEIPLRPIEDVTWWRRLASAAGVAMAVVWTWWYATLPAALAAGWLLVVLGLGELIAAGALAGIIAGTFAVEAHLIRRSWLPLDGRVWCPERLWAWGVRFDAGHSIERTLLLAKRLRWHRIASRADLSAPVDGHNRAPDLLAYRRDLTQLRAGWCQFVVRPLIPAPRETWPRMGDQLVRSMDWAEATTEIGDRNRVTITMIREPLPAMLTAPPEVGSEEGFVVLGEAVGTGVFGWRPDDTPHLTITGITGGGKGSTVRLIERHALRHGWEIYRANPTLTGESAWLAGHAAVADTPVGMWAMADHVHDRMRARQERVKAAGVDSWLELEDSGRRVVFIIDESANLISPGLKDERRPFAMATSQTVTSMAQMARSAGVHLVILTQHPGVDSYGYAGGQTRLNIGARMIVGRTEAIWIRELFVGDLDPTVAYALAADVKGRCVYQGLAASDGGRASKGQVYYLTQQAAAMALDGRPPVDVVDFDAEGPERWRAMIDALDATADGGRARRSRRKGGQS